jgi:hypothetical protein
VAAARVAVPSGGEVVLRPADGSDEVFALDTAATDVPGSRATRLIGRCLMDGQDASDLTIGDREALLLQLRRITFGERIDCVLHCPADGCGEPMDLALSVGELLVASREDVQATYDLAVDADGAAYRISYRLPRASDLDAAVGLAPAEPERAAGELARRCVLRIVRDDAPVEAIPDTVRAALGAAMAERDPQAELELDVVCPECGRPFTALFDSASFLLGELEARAAELLRDVHTLALHYHWSEQEILGLAPQRRGEYLELLGAAVAGSR